MIKFTWSKKVIFLLSWIFGSTLLIVSISGYLYFQATSPLSQVKRERIITIKPGMNLQGVAKELQYKRLIRSALAFRIMAYIKKKQNLIKVGEYKISPSLSPPVILAKITSGQSVLYPITIPEGYRITEIASLLEEKGLAQKDRFLELCNSPDWAKTLNLPSNSLEGYLFPETYNFSKNPGEQKILKTFLDTFKSRVMKPEILNRAKEIGLTLHEVITLASLIEKETGKGSERPLISSVFHNRLKKKMLLQTDPTVIYAIPNFDGNIRKKDLSIDSPYNTYKYPGLPPGPIANPGFDSIHAALYPAESEFLYFVSRQNGSHQFSKDLQSHNRAVAKFQLNKS